MMEMTFYHSNSETMQLQTLMQTAEEAREAWAKLAERDEAGRRMRGDMPASQAARAGDIPDKSDMALARNRHQRRVAARRGRGG